MLEVEPDLESPDEHISIIRSLKAVYQSWQTNAQIHYNYNTSLIYPL